MAERFGAAAQYDDLTGTAAADWADAGQAQDTLRKKGGLSADEFIVGMELWMGENRGLGAPAVPSVHLHIMDAGGFDDAQRTVRRAAGPVATRRVTVELTVAEFFGLFKRFSVALSPGGMLTDREVDPQDV